MNGKKYDFSGCIKVEQICHQQTCTTINVKRSPVAVDDDSRWNPDLHKDGDQWKW